MLLSAEKKGFIVMVDRKIQAHLIKNSTDKKILVSMTKEMPTIKNIISSTSKQEMNKLCKQYDGFYYFMKLLENLAVGISNGSIVVPK